MSVKKRHILLFLLLSTALLPACEPGDGSLSEPVLLKRHVLTLKDFWDDLTLTADPRNLVAASFRETPIWASLPRNCDGDCIGAIPYRLDQATFLVFQWTYQVNGSVEYATLTDSGGIELLRLEPGDVSPPIHLPPGDYLIQIFRADKNDKTAVYIQPEPDINEPLFNHRTTPYPDKLIFQSGECLNCNLSGGNLFQSLMEKNDLRGSNLSGANLFQANLGQSVLSHANLAGANVFQAKLPLAELKGASLAGANVFQSDFTSADFSEASMPGVNAPEACFEAANLRDADISGAVMGYVNAPQADFSGANLKGTIFIYSVLTNASFYGADLSEADLTGANITGADFTAADMTDATWIDGEKCTGPFVDSCR